MAAKEPCDVLAMILAERVFREEGSHKVHIAGTFNQINAHSFPAVHALMHVFVAFTNAEAGTHKAEITIRYADDKEIAPIAAAQGAVESEGRDAGTEMNVGFERITFPRPGVTEVVFALDGKCVASRKLKVVKTGGK